MKKALTIVSVFATLWTSPLIAADKDKATPSIEERLCQAELSAVLKQFKKVKFLQYQAGVEAALATDEKEQKVLAKRAEVLAKHAEGLREQAHECDAAIRKHREVAAAAK